MGVREVGHTQDCLWKYRRQQAANLTSHHSSVGELRPEVLLEM